MTNAAYSFVELARNLTMYENYKSALNMYVCAFNSEPLIKDQMEPEFRGVLLKRNAQLASVDNKAEYDNRAEIFSNFEKSIKIFPGNVDLLNDIGRYLYRYHYFPEALCHFEKALNINNSSAVIEKNLNSAKSVLFPRNKFRVLNDKVRNLAFRAAIRSCVNADTDSVLNIDAGSGLLALYAHECGTVAITACEGSVTMAQLAECVMQANNAPEVKMINKPAFCLNKKDIYGCRSLLLTDIIDAGIFGEFILQSVCYAWENLICSGSKVIPGKAEYFVVGVNCHDLNKRFQLCQKMKDMLNVPNLNVHTATYYGETYYGEDVHLYDNVKYVSKPKLLFTIDFNNYQDLNEKMYKRELYNVELTATEDTEINMVIGWFNLYLTDDIMLTTNPRDENRTAAWPQAVFFDVIPRKMCIDETYSLSFSTYAGRLTTMEDKNISISRISPGALALLNDIEYVNMIQRSIGVVCVHLGQTVCIEEVNIVDLSPFPLFGILMMKRGANSLICLSKSSDDKEFIKVILKSNEIPANKVTISNVNRLSKQDLTSHTVHVIFSNIIEFNGDIDGKIKQLIQQLSMTCLVPYGLCLPSSVTVIGQLVNSEQLEINNSINDDNVGYSLAKYLNGYKITQTMELDIGKLKYEALSQEFEVVACEDITSDLIPVNILKDGQCNAIICWYKIQLFKNWPAIYTNRCNSFVDGMAFINSSVIKVFKDDEVNVLRCADSDGSYKLVLDMEP